MPSQRFHILDYILARLLSLTQNRLQIRKRQLICLFELPVIFVFLLDCIIRQMPKKVARIVTELLGTRPQVPFFVPVCMQLPRNRCYQHITPNVELSIPVQQWVYVLLNQTALTLLPQLLNRTDNALFSPYYRYSLAAVRIFSRLYYKKTVFVELLISENLFHF
jgi:hypothetical protein